MDNAFGIAGLFGWPVAHSRSPVIHNHWLAHHGIPGRYVLFPVPPAKLETAVRGLAGLGLGLRGCNVTTPHKQASFPLRRLGYGDDRCCGLMPAALTTRPAWPLARARTPETSRHAAARVRFSRRGKRHLL